MKSLRHLFAASILLDIGSTNLASAQPERMGMIAQEDLTPEQKASMERLAAGPRGAFRGGPFTPLLRDPVLLDHMQEMGAHLRWGDSPVSVQLREIAMMAVTRHWNNPIEFNAHAALAIKAGVSEALVRQLASGRRPRTASDDELAVFDFIHELFEKKTVGDRNYNRLLARVGEKGVVHILGICTYYSGTSMLVNVNRSAPPPGLVEYWAPK